MSLLLNSPGGRAWADRQLNDKLRRRLPGRYEYECYTTMVSYVLDVLEKLKVKLKIVDNQVSITTGRNWSRFCFEVDSH